VISPPPRKASWGQRLPYATAWTARVRCDFAGEADQMELFAAAPESSLEPCLATVAIPLPLRQREDAEGESARGQTDPPGL